MARLRNIIAHGKFVAVVYLVVALILVQGAGWHWHSDNPPHQKGTVTTVLDHVHYERAHTAHDSSLLDHVDEVASTFEFSTPVTSKNALAGSLVMVLFAIAIVLLSPFVYFFVGRCRRDDRPPVAARYALHPPLRAPPR